MSSLPYVTTVPVGMAVHRDQRGVSPTVDIGVREVFIRVMFGGDVPEIIQMALVKDPGSNTWMIFPRAPLNGERSLLFNRHHSGVGSIYHARVTGKSIGIFRREFVKQTEWAVKRDVVGDVVSAQWVSPKGWGTTADTAGTVTESILKDEDDKNLHVWTSEEKREQRIAVWDYLLARGRYTSGDMVLTLAGSSPEELLLLSKMGIRIQNVVLVDNDNQVNSHLSRNLPSGIEPVRHTRNLASVLTHRALDVGSIIAANLDFCGHVSTFTHELQEFIRSGVLADNSRISVTYERGRDKGVDAACKTFGCTRGDFVIQAVAAACIDVGLCIAAPPRQVEYNTSSNMAYILFQLVPMVPVVESTVPVVVTENPGLDVVSADALVQRLNRLTRETSSQLLVTVPDGQHYTKTVAVLDVVGTQPLPNA